MSRAKEVEIPEASRAMLLANSLGILATIRVHAEQVQQVALASLIQEIMTKVGATFGQTTMQIMSEAWTAERDHCHG